MLGRKESRIRAKPNVKWIRGCSCGRVEVPFDISWSRIDSPIRQKLVRCKDSDGTIQISHWSVSGRENNAVPQRQRHDWPIEEQQGGNYGQSRVMVMRRLISQSRGKKGGGGNYITQGLRTLSSLWLRRLLSKEGRGLSYTLRITMTAMWGGLGNKGESCETSQETLAIVQATVMVVRPDVNSVEMVRIDGFWIYLKGFTT